jgi:sterol desaturase/sphingolipid hydroxylase (fatty acid hydroxylase superfamily)
MGKTVFDLGALRNLLLPGLDVGTLWPTAIFWLTLVLLAGLEIMLPLHPDSRRDRRWPANLGLGLINLGLLPLVPVSSVVAAEWARANHIGLFNEFSLPWGVVALATVIVRSGAGYALHVLLHRVGPLWRIHRVHHFDTGIDVSTGFRTHPLEFVLAIGLGVLIAVSFGLSPITLIVYETADAAFAFVTHANLRLSPRLDRILRHVIVTPTVHLVHHSPRREETDSNYGNLLTIWDRLFGTYREPELLGHDLCEFGLGEVRDDRAHDLWWQLKSPLLAELAAPAESGAAQKP